MPLRGVARLIRYRSTAVSTHELPSREAVCPSPFQPSRTPDFRSRVSACAHRNGVAGSRVVPTTRIGGALAARSGTGAAAGTGQYAQGRLLHTFAAPNCGAAIAAVAAAERHALSDRGTGRSMQFTAMFASIRLEYCPFGCRSASESASTTISVPFPANAPVRPARRYCQNDLLYSANATPLSSIAELAGRPAIRLVNGLLSVRSSSPCSRAIPAFTVPWPSGQDGSRTQLAVNDRSATSNPCAWTRFMLNVDSSGLTAPSSTRARTWVGNSCA